MMSIMQTMMPMMEKMTPPMEKMMQGGMMQGGMMRDKPTDTAGMSDAAKAYMEAMKRMDGPMMHGIQAGDPDVAVVQAMIPHHQGAIDMARAVVQFGKSHRQVALGLPDRRHPSGQVFPACRAELCQKVQAAPVDFVL